MYRDFVTRVPNGSADKAAQEATVVNTEHYVNDEEGWTKFVDPPFVGSAMIRNAVDTAMDYLFDGDEGRMTPDGVISYYYQSGESHCTSALDGLGYTLDGNHSVVQF